MFIDELLDRIFGSDGNSGTGSVLVDWSRWETWGLTWARLLQIPYHRVILPITAAVILIGLPVGLAVVARAAVTSGQMKAGQGMALCIAGWLAMAMSLLFVREIRRGDVVAIESSWGGLGGGLGGWRVSASACYVFAATVFGSLMIAVVFASPPENKLSEEVKKQLSEEVKKQLSDETKALSKHVNKLVEDANKLGDRKNGQSSGGGAAVPGKPGTVASGKPATVESDKPAPAESGDSPVGESVEPAPVAPANPAPLSG